MLAIGPTRATGAWLLDAPCNLGQLLAKLGTAVGETPRLRQCIKRVAVWHVWRDFEQLSLQDNVIVVRDPALRDLADLRRVLGIVRRLNLPENAPPWLCLVVNPQIEGEAPPPEGALSAIVLHFNHAIADAMRIQRLLFGLDAAPASTDLSSGAVRLEAPKPIDGDAYADLPRDPRISETGMALLSVPVAALRRARAEGQNTTEQVLLAAAAVFDDPKLFNLGRRRKDQAVVTRYTRHGGDTHHLGNFVVASEYLVRGGEGSAEQDGLSRGRSSDVLQALASPLPPVLLKRLVGHWYGNYDILLNLIPTGRARFSLGGQRVTGIYGVPPIFAPLPLTIDVVSHAGLHFITLVPGEGFIGDEDDLARSYEAALCGTPSR